MYNFNQLLKILSIKCLKTVQIMRIFEKLYGFQKLDTFEKF